MQFYFLLICVVKPDWLNREKPIFITLQKYKSIYSYQKYAYILKNIHTFAAHLHFYSHMRQKEKRLEIIKKLISEHKINNQAELLEWMKSKGFEATQATLSRDIKLLKIIKTPDEKGDYIYRIPEENIYAKEIISANTSPSIEFSDSLAVMKTSPGYAMGIASDIDQLITRGIMGTIAGDDTILLILRKGFVKSQIIDDLSQIIPSIREMNN